MWRGPRACDRLCGRPLVASGAVVVALIVVAAVAAVGEDHYDLVLVDCQPSISLVSEAVFDAADALLVSLIPSTLSLRTFDQLSAYVHDEVERAPQTIAFFSMVDGRKKLHREIVAQLLAERAEMVSVGIPAATEVELMGVHRQAMVRSAPRSRAARAYRQLWGEIRARVDLSGDRVDEHPPVRVR